MSLDRIPIVSTDPGQGLTGQAEALLREIAALLEQLVVEGEVGSIDLHSLPLSPADLEWLRARLGTGEVSIRLDAGGTSLLRETGVAGVWWVEHRNEMENRIGEFIEVAPVPSLIPAYPEDIAQALARLRAMLD